MEWIGFVIPAGGGPQFVRESRTHGPSRTFQPKSAPGAARSTSSHLAAPTSLMFIRVLPGSDANRNGLRRPLA